MTVVVPIPAEGTNTRNKARQERDRFVALAFCWGEFLVELDALGVVAFAAGAVESLVGFAPGKLIGRPFFDLIADEDRALVKQLVDYASRGGRIEGVTLRLCRNDGALAPLQVAGYRLDELDGHYFLAFRRAPKAVLKAAVRDSQSGLLEPESFVEVITGGDGDGNLAPGQQMTFLGASDYADLQKRLDADAENELQAQIGSLLKAQSVGGDAAMRLGAGMYGLLHDSDLDVTRLQSGIDDIIRSADPERRGVSLKAATLVIDEEAYRNTDVAKGLVFSINRFRLAQGDAFSLEELSNSLSSLTSDAVDTVRAFRQMVATSSFETVFQPIVDASTGAIHHYEALARFEKTDGPSPYQQILFAEDTGLIVDFDLAMVQKIIKWLKTAPRNFETVVAVNISGYSVGETQFAAALDRILTDNAWTRGRLMFEITESARMERLGAADQFIQHLRKQGYHVCLDDFGAGASNFQYLSRLQVDTVKLDGVAIRNARNGPKGKAFLRALVYLCDSLDVSTIAEMIEDETDLWFVRSCGIEFVQGFLFGKPGPDIAALANHIPHHLFQEKATA